MFTGKYWGCGGPVEALRYFGTRPSMKVKATTYFFLIGLLGGILLVLTLAGCSPEAKKARYLGHGERYFKAGEYENAKIEYMKLLLADPHSALPYQRLGLIWQEEGAPLRAISFLFKARELAPNDLSNRVTLARALILLERTAEARKELTAILEQSPAHDDALILLADTDQTREDVEYTDQYLKKHSEPKSLSFALVSANLAVQKGDFASAAVFLDRALAVDPKSQLPHLAMANFDVYRKKLSEADQEFKTAVELSPLRSSTRLRYAEFKMQNGAAGEVKELFKETTRQAPDYLPAWCFLSQIALTNGKYDESLKLLENVFTRDPQNPDARLLEAEAWLAKGDTKKAVERFENLEKSYTHVPVIEYQLAQAYLRNKNPGQAIVALGHAIAAKPDYVEAILLRGELDLQTGDASLVVSSMLNALKQWPHLSRAELLLTEAYLSLGRFEEAAAVIREQIRVSPGEPDPYYRLGLLLRERNKIDEAHAAFEKVLELAPGNLMAINQLVDLDLAKRDFNSARSRVQGELKKTPVSAIAYFMEGKTYAAEGNLDQAEASLRKALDLDSNSLGIYQLLISTYLSANKPNEAIGQLEALLSKNPNEAWALMTLASTYGKVGNFAKACATYERVLSANPDSAEAMNKLASLYNDQFNQPDKAYGLASKARTLAPVDPGIADTLGWTFYKQGNYQQAIDLVREALDKRPDNPETQFHFGMASYMMDQPEAARVAFKKALATKADFPHKEEAARWLAFLEDDSGAPKQFSARELEALVELQPKDLVARSRLAALYEKQGAAAKAASQYESALNINPKLADAALKLAQLYAGPLQNPGKALEMAKTARQLDKRNLRTARTLGEIAYQTGNFVWAYDLLIESAHGQREDGSIAYDLAWAAYSLGKVPEAEQRMRRALELGTDARHAADAQRFLDLIALEQNSKDVARSDAEIQEQLKEDPNYVPALMMKAAIQIKQGGSEAAIDTYNTILQRFPDFAPAQKKLAYLYLGDPTTLKRAYELALSARNSLPEDPEVARTLGELCYERKDYAYALQLLQESAKRASLDARGLYCLGMCYLAAQAEPESRDALTRSLTAGLQEPFASEARRVLRDLEKKRKGS